MITVLKKYNQTIILALSTLLITLFIYLTPPGPLAEFLPGLSLFQNVKGDLPEYISRFALSSLLFGLVPLLYMRFSGKGLTHLGLGKINLNFFKDRLYIFLIFFCLAIGISSSFDKSLSAFYPYSKALAEMTIHRHWSFSLIHSLSYILFYYIPWEIFFRGFLIFPFLPEPEKKGISPHLLMIASFQIIPSSLVHFGHPITETMGAIPFGIICAWLVLKYRSIIPGLILHIITGVTMDLFIIFN